VLRAGVVADPSVVNALAVLGGQVRLWSLLTRWLQLEAQARDHDCSMAATILPCELSFPQM
jgi:hypothetical protein